MKICAHTLCRNEEKYIWYSVASVINHVDRIMIWDMKSTDNTFRILQEIKTLYPNKVDILQTETNDPHEFTNLRQKMLEGTKEDWVIIVDGDEVWWDEKIKETADLIRKEGNRIDSIVNRYKNLIGDIYHYQEEAASHYLIDGIRGSVTIRAMNKTIPGLHYDKPHGTQGIFNENNVLIQEMNSKKRRHIKGDSYLHFTHLPRSSSRSEDAQVNKRKMKYKHELGIAFPRDFYYPEAFFRKRPEIVSSVWDKRNAKYMFRSVLETYPKKMRRRYLRIPEGY